VDANWKELAFVEMKVLAFAASSHGERAEMLGAGLNL
jgi:hypothetical protein